MPDSSVLPTVIHDGHVILGCNAEFCDLFECSRAELIGMRMEHIIHDLDLRRLAILRGKRIMDQSHDKEHTMEYPFRRCNGTVFWGKSFSRRIGPHRYETKIKWQYDDDWD